MFTNIIKELLGTKVVECNSQTLIIDDEYESSNIASQKEIGRISGNLDLSHTRYTHLYKLWTSL